MVSSVMQAPSRLSLFSIFFLAAFCACSTPLAENAELDQDPWEEVTDISEPKGSLHQEEREPGHIETPLVEPTAAFPAKQTKKGAVASWEKLTVRRFKVEIAILAFCIVYILNIVRGRQANSKIAQAWAQEFCKAGGVFDSNFALLGTGEGKAPLIRHSASEFQLYCTGRRFCKFAEATLKLRSRQDLFALVVGLVYPSEDQLDIEVYMKEADMPPMVLAIATKKLMKAALKEDTGEDDIRKLTHKMEVGREKIPSWPTDKLVVHAEHSSLFYDIMTDKIIEQIFSQQAFAWHSKYFRLLHFTSEQSYGPVDQRAVLRFSYTLPPIHEMYKLTKLMSATAVFVDIIGNYKLSPDMRKRAEKVRQDLSRKDLKDKSKEQQELQDERRLAKRADEMEKLKRMTPEQREKYEARKAKIENSRAQKRFVRRA